MAWRGARLSIGKHSECAIVSALDSLTLQGETRFSPPSMQGSAQPEEVFPSSNREDTIAGTSGPSSGVVGDKSNGSASLQETELDSALQLLVERAQYITGATGAAIAVPQGQEMVCRASAGASAPSVGTRLQVRSGLTGESITRRQLLRCDNSETDPRVNLETCRAVGIASIVVLPLLRRDGEVRGLFELFSDHAYAFEERDLIALERMAALTVTALDLAEERKISAPSAPVSMTGVKGQELVDSVMPNIAAEIPVIVAVPEFVAPEAQVVEAQIVEAQVEPYHVEPHVEPHIEGPVVPTLPPAPLADSVTASVPEAMLRVQKCASCGFPVSEGRTLCLDCEAKDGEKKRSELVRTETRQEASSESAPMTEEPLPAFLANALPAQESWLSNHVNLLAIVVLILGILVAVVVFR
jgi:putative methionine-R-sulfoxide reductase with GAF domain